MRVIQTFSIGLFMCHNIIISLFKDSVVDISYQRIRKALNMEMCTYYLRLAIAVTV
jgi:hypothetical protein